MQGNRLLIIDDQAAVAEVIAMIAAACGYQVEMTVDPAKFLDRVDEWEPTHILLDLNMPVVDGVELLCILGSRRCGAKIVIASGLDVELVEAARRLGVERGLDVAATLLKPFRTGELRRILGQLRLGESGLNQGVLAAVPHPNVPENARRPEIGLAPAAWSPSVGIYDGSDEVKAALVRMLCDRINPLWDMGRNSLIGWRPAGGGILVLLAPYTSIVDRFDESQRLLHGQRLMGEGTFLAAQQVAGCKPVRIDLPFRIGDESPGAAPTEVVEQVLRRYGITETRHRAVGLFDIVGFSRCEPRLQVAQLNSLECSINTAQGTLRAIGNSIDLARTPTGDGFFIWNRDKGPQHDLDTYLVTLLVLVDNAIARQSEHGGLAPQLRACFSIGPHYSYHQVDGPDPRGHDYIVGDVTIALARMVSKCLPDQVLIGDFSRPDDEAPGLATPLQFVERAERAFGRLAQVRLAGQVVNGLRCYFTGPQRLPGEFDSECFSISDKHGFEHRVFNQKFNVSLRPANDMASAVDRLFVGKQHADLGDFEARALSDVA